jgi:hypothetical protein
MADDKLATIHDALKDTLKWGRASDALADLVPWIEWVTAHGDRLHAIDKSKHVKVCAMLAEVADHSGLYAQAAKAIARADAWFGGLKQHPDDDLLYVRECLRARVVSAFVKEYRQGHLGSARESIEECVALMERLAETTPSKMWATRGQAHRYLAEVERTTHQYERSRQLLFRALDCYHQRFQHEVEAAANLAADARADRLKEETAFLQHRSALCFLSISRVDYLRGVAGAEESARAAQALLANGSDPLSLATVCLVRGLIQRNQFKKYDPPEELEAPRKLIEKALEVFEEHHHDPKLLWALYEHAVLVIVARRRHEAGQALTKVEKTARKLIAQSAGIGGEWMERRAWRFIAYSYARRSRLARELSGWSHQALRWAERALKEAEDRRLPRARVDAMIARASARLMDNTPQNAASAEKDLRDAQKRGERAGALDARFRAVIAALLAQCRLRQEDLAGAESWLQRARVHAAHIDHANVRTLIDEISSEVDETHGSVVLRVEDVTTYDDAKEKLRKFLVDVSDRLQLSPVEAAKQFQVGAATFYRWLDAAEAQRARRRAAKEPARRKQR